MFKHVGWLAISALFSVSVLAADGAVVTGKATFKGQAPPRKEIDTSADPNCCKDHPKPQTEDIIVNANGTLRNVVVYVKAGIDENKEFPAPKEPVNVTQIGCRYDPHVVTLMVGQELKVDNGDNTLHNVHGLPRQASEFNLVQAKKGNSNTFTFKAPEMPGFLLKCDVHAWMRSYIWVFSHPYFSITRDDGTFTLPALPPGEYTIGAWSEKCGVREQKITVGKDKVELTFEFEPKKKL